MPITKGDTVRVMPGEDKGKEGKVLRSSQDWARDRRGDQHVKKHRKARRAEEQSGHHRDAGPVRSFERDAARSQVGQADACPRADRWTPTARRSASAPRAGNHPAQSAEARTMTMATTKKGGAPAKKPKAVAPAGGKGGEDKSMLPKATAPGRRSSVGAGAAPARRTTRRRWCEAHAAVRADQPAPGAGADEDRAQRRAGRSDQAAQAARRRWSRSWR
jgi:hypothetical protein